MDASQPEDDAPEAFESPLKSRVLIYSQKDAVFSVRDASGKEVHDLWPFFSRRPAEQDVRVSIAGAAFTAISQHPWWLPSIEKHPGLDTQHPSRMAISWTTDGGDTHVEVRTLAGRLLGTADAPGHFDAFITSATAQFVVGVELTGTTAKQVTRGALIRVADGEVLWEGPGTDFQVAPDESYFVHVDRWGQGGTVLSLRTEETFPFNPRDLDNNNSRASVAATSALGAVLRVTNTRRIGTALWAVTPEGRLLPFDPTLPPGPELDNSDSADLFYTGATFLSLMTDPLRALWLRSTTPLGRPTLMAYDFAEGSSRQIADHIFCPPSSRFETLGTSLLACDCSERCTTAAELPELPTTWVYYATVSPDNRFAFVCTQWTLNRSPAPDEFPECFIYGRDGSLIETLPWGTGDFDPLARLFVLETDWERQQLILVDIQRGHTSKMVGLHWKVLE